MQNNIKMRAILALIFVFSEVCGQTQVKVDTEPKDRVFVKDHRKYMENVIQEVVYQVEEMGWCNLKLPDITFQIDEKIFQRSYTGTLTYKNGFLVSVNDVSITNSSLQQEWKMVEEAVRAEIKGQLRMADASLGYDIEANFTDGIHYYTGVVKHPLLTFDFSVFYWPDTRQKSVKVRGDQPLSSIIIDILPQDKTSDALTTLFKIESTAEGIKSWGPEVLEPFATDVIHNRVEFPGLCYNCPRPN